MTRAERRRRAERAKARAKRYYGGWWNEFGGTMTPLRRATFLGRSARTPKPCSSWCCGNPRRRFHHRSLQEQREAPRLTPALARQLVAEGNALRQVVADAARGMQIDAEDLATLVR